MVHHHDVPLPFAPRLHRLATVRHGAHAAAEALEQPNCQPPADGVVLCQQHAASEERHWVDWLFSLRSEGRAQLRPAWPVERRREGGALPSDAHRRQRAPHRDDETLREGQAEARASVAAARSGVVDLAEVLEEPVHPVRWYANARVGHLEDEGAGRKLLITFIQPRADDDSTAVRGELHRVRHEVRQHLA